MKYTINGKEVTRDEFNAHGEKNDDWLKEAFQSIPNTYRGHDPLVSEGLGCMKSQVGDMRDTIKRHNIQGVSVRDSGQLEITSRRGRRELLKVRGLVDADGSYGD